MNKKVNLLPILALSLFLFFGFGCGRQEVKIIGQSSVTTEETEKLSPRETTQEAVSYLREVTSNPFLTQEEEERAFAEKGKRIPIDYFVLSAILYSSSASKAIINGQILEKGNTIDNKEIIDILPDAVILKDSQSEYVVRLKILAEK